MAGLLAATLALTVSPPGGSAAVNATATITPEQHGESMRRRVKVPAASTNFEIPVADFATVALILLIGNGVFTYRIGTTGATARTCRKFALETPNNEVITSVYITTTLAEVEVDILVVGD